MAGGGVVALNSTLRNLSLSPVGVLRGVRSVKSAGALQLECKARLVIDLGCVVLARGHIHRLG